MKRLLLSKLRTGNNQFLALLQRTLLLAILLVGASSAWADNRLVLAESIKIGADDGGWAGTTIPASAFEKIQEGDVIEITRSDDTSHALTLSAGTWGDAFEIFRNYGWTATTENIIIQETILGDNTYTADQIIEKIKEKGIILNGSGPMYVKVSLILKGNNRIALSGNITYTGLTDKVAQIGDPVTYTYTLDSKFADAENVKYKWFITDRAAGDLVADNPYIYEYQVGTPGESNTFTFYPSAATSSGQNLMVCVHVSADGYNTDYAADWGNFTIAPMHKPTITQDGTNVNINVNAGHWISYKVNGGEAFPNYGNSVTLPNTNITALNDGDVITAHTWRPVDLTTSHYPESEDVSFTYTIASPDPTPEGEADFTNRGMGDVTLIDRVLTSTADWNNWANIFVFESGSNQNVTKTADNFTGITITAQGDPFRIIVYYNEGNAQKRIEATSSNTVSTFMWSDFGLTDDQIPNITRIAIAGTKNGDKTTFKNAYLINPEKPFVFLNCDEEHTIKVGKTTKISCTNSAGSFTTWDLYEGNPNNGGTHLGFIGYMNDFTFDPEVGVKDANNGNLLKSGAGDYYFVAGAGIDNGNGGWNWADKKVCKVTVLPKPENCKVTFSIPQVFFVSIDQSKLIAERKDGDNWIAISSGDYVPYGATVRFTANDFAQNASTTSGDVTIGANRIVLQNWNLKVGSEAAEDFRGNIANSGIVWSDDKSSYEMVVDDDIEFKAIYNLSYVIHYEGANSVNNTEKIATYVHGTVTAYIGNDQINEWSGFRGNTEVIVKATPEDGWVIDHWEGRLVGTEEVWRNENWANTSTLTFTSGVSFNNAWGQDIYIKPVFKELTYTQTKINVEYGDETKEREFIVYAPESVAGMENVPVVFSLHGTGNDNDPDVYGVQNYNELANANNFIVVYPRGLIRNFPVFGGDARGWMSDGKYNEDVKFFEDIINWLGNHSSEINNCTIDKNRVYMTGFSNGGMMAYSTAFTSDKFAAYSSVSGLQLNEFHLQHFGQLKYLGDKQNIKPGLTPFMHIHGTKDDFVKYTLMPTIVDNMVYRNGCNPIPTVTDGDANVYGTATRYKRSEYTSTIDANVKYVYYEIGTGMSAGDTGMGHNPECGIDSENSKNKIWAFMSQYTLSDSPAGGLKNYNNANNIIFKPMIEQYATSTNSQGVKEFEATNHGWTMYQGKVLAQYGDIRNSTADKQYVYHTIQLHNGWNTIKFNASCTNALGRFLTLRIERVATFDKETNEVYPLSTPKEVVKENYALDGTAISHSFWINESAFDLAEYRLSIIVEDQDKLSNDQFDATGFPQDPVLISGITIDAKGSQTETGTHCDPPVDTDFAGYFNYHNRLIAQWNFDLSDNNRCNLDALVANSQYWTADYSSASADHKYGTIVFAYNKTLDDAELKYDGNALIPVAAGLRFYADPNQVKIQATVHAGKVEKIQLVLDKGVRMYIPYVRNSYRNDRNSDYTPFDVGTQTYHEDLMTSDWMDCLHHINRDIVYFNCTPDIWKAIDNRCYEDGQMSASDYHLFNSGGYDNVDGKTWAKCNFTGTQGKPCIITIAQPTTFDRIGVNRNLVYSFYTENILADAGIDRPTAGFRIIGTPRGAKIADVGATYAGYENAIAMTYGGWKYNNNVFKDGAGETKTDKWGELTVFGEDPLIDYSQASTEYDKVPIATDGFPVYSSLQNAAYNENVNKDAIEIGLADDRSYHDHNDGGFYLTKEDGGAYDYIENLTPWSLPCRGAYAKFEPTLPGVLNVHIFQEKNKDYYIADEFGHLIKTNVFTKTGTEQTVTNNNGHFSITRSDNVKYSFDVYPGKTYYLFSNTGKMGITGFNFEPYVYRKYNSLAEAGNDIEAWELDRNNVTINTAAVNETNGYTSPESLDWTMWSENVFGYSNQTAEFHDDVYTDRPKHTQGDYKSGDGVVKNEPMTLDNRAVHVNYTRTFKTKMWNPICLPFSMNNLQLQEQFGKDFKVILLRDVQEIDPVTNECTANFIYHINQDIIAGYPYLIYPSKDWDITSIQANVYVSDEHNVAAGGKQNAPSLVTVNSIGQNTVSYPGDGAGADYYYANASSDYNYRGIKCYTWKGLFETETVPVGSYAVLASTGKFTRVTSTTAKMKPFRAYMSHAGAGDYPHNEAKCRIMSTNYQDIDDVFEATDIEDMLLEQGIVGSKTNVYSINGQIVRANTDDLSGLPKGMYIVNGKKYLVK